MNHEWLTHRDKGHTSHVDGLDKVSYHPYFPDCKCHMGYGPKCKVCNATYCPRCEGEPKGCSILKKFMAMVKK